MLDMELSKIALNIALWNLHCEWSMVTFGPLIFVPRPVGATIALL